MGLKGGSKIRHIHGENLRELEVALESLDYKADIISINKVGSQWFIHFYIPELQFDRPTVVKEVAKKTKTKTKRGAE